MPAEFNLAEVDAALADTVFAGQMHHLSCTPSTSTLALEAAQAGVSAGVWIADEQTAGRGRGGHTWHSVAGDGLYVSVLLRPRLTGIDALKLSLAAGIAAQAAVDGVTGLAVDIRWPNDLLCAGKKFGGILTESAMDGGDGALSYAVIGLGMNLNHAAMPEDLREFATSLRMISGDVVRREDLLPALLCNLESEVALVEREASGQPGRSIAERFAQASTWVRGMRVQVAEAGGYTGLTDGLDDHGLLRVLADDGSRRTVRHGGVRAVR